MDLLIVDDDVHWTSLLMAMAEELGLSCERLHNGQQALKEIGRIRPRVLVVDIMMPGMDGLSLCRQLKSNPMNAALKVIVASGKPFKSDKAEALRCGAVAFFEKGQGVLELGKMLLDLARAQGPSDPGEPPGGRVPVFRVRFWGCRGPGGADPSKMTSCVSVEFGPRIVILDAGSGLDCFFDSKSTPEKDLWVLLTHYREDHISGLSSLARVDASHIVVAGPQDTRTSLKMVLEKRLPLELVVRLNTLCIPESAFPLSPGLSVRSLLTRHPGAALAYRLEYQGRVIVYCPDNEIEPEGEKSDYSVKLAEFVRGADLLIHDARYLDEDYASHREEGHSSFGSAVRLAADGGARRLALFNIDAGYSRAQLDAGLLRARASLMPAPPPLQIFLPTPGAYLDV